MLTESQEKRLRDLAQSSVVGGYIKAVMDEIDLLREALKSANAMCRSAMSIAERDGNDTHWWAFRKRMEASLELQHRIMFPPVKERLK